MPIERKMEPRKRGDDAFKLKGKELGNKMFRLNKKKGFEEIKEKSKRLYEIKRDKRLRKELLKNEEIYS